MRTGTKKCILLLLAIIVLCFAVWLLWPHSFAEVTGIPAEYPDLNMAAIVTAARFENGSPSFDIWNLQYCSSGSTEYEAVLSVLSSASYRQDLRNLLPGGLTSVSSDKDYDSRSVNLMFAWGRFEDECCSLPSQAHRWSSPDRTTVDFRFIIQSILNFLTGLSQKCRLTASKTE